MCSALGSSPTWAFTPEVADLEVSGETLNTVADIQNINMNGIANDTSINAEGYQYVSEGGIANDTSINAEGGQQVVYDGGTANGTTINSVRSWQRIYEGGVANGTTINHGEQHVNAGATASDTTINDGEQAVYQDGIANNTTINDGLQNVNGTANKTVINDGLQSVKGIANDTTVNGGLQFVDRSGIANTTVINAGRQKVNGGTANNTTINGGGVQQVSWEGIVNNTTINADGQLLIDEDSKLVGQTVVNDQGELLSYDWLYATPGGSIHNEGELIFQRTEDYALEAVLTGTGGLTLNSHSLLLSYANTYTGATTVNAGILQAGAEHVFSMYSDYLIQAAGTLDLNGYSQTIQSLDNHGAVNFGGHGGNALTIIGDYQGNGGLLNINSVLGDDDSITDKLTVGGNTSGTTLVQVNNLGGHGAQTLNGIELISVAGQSDGEFVQRGRIVAGAYDYFLGRGVGSNSANWYLNSAVPVEPSEELESPALEPSEELESPVESGPRVERPEASGYSSNLAAANTMFAIRLHDRQGESHYIDALTGEQKTTTLWLRNEGGHQRVRDTQDQLRTQSNRYVVQLGGDIAQWSLTGEDRLSLGLMAGYGNTKSRTESRLSGYAARASVDGYSTGLFATWYANNRDKSGLYVDSWAQYGWFNNRVNGQGLTAEEYQTKGFSTSLESGYTWRLGADTNGTTAYFIQPQAQVTWMGVKADEHTEANGTRVSGEGDGNVQTRLGVKAFMKVPGEPQGKSADRVFQPYVELNWLHNTKDFGTTMDEVSVKQNGAANIAEVKVGAEGQLTRQASVWGNVGQQVGNQGYSDTSVILGVKYRF